jgi:hypothetical protein
MQIPIPPRQSSCLDRCIDLIKEWWRRKPKLKAIAGFCLISAGIGGTSGFGQQIIAAILESVGISGAKFFPTTATLVLSMIGSGCFLLVHDPKPKVSIKRRQEELNISGLDGELIEGLVRNTVKIRIKREREDGTFELEVDGLNSREAQELLKLAVADLDQAASPDSILQVRRPDGLRLQPLNKLDLALVNEALLSSSVEDSFHVLTKCHSRGFSEVF